MERSANSPTIADVRASIRAERAKLPKVNANGYPLPYASQSDEYRAVVTREAHERAHGSGYRGEHHIGRDV